MPSARFGELLRGILYDARTNLSIRFTQQMHNFVQGGAATPVESGATGTEVIPKDANASEVKVFDIDQFAQDNKDFYVHSAGRLNLNGSLPDILTGITITWNTGNVTGASAAVTDYAAFVDGGTASVRPHTSAQSGASVMPSMSPTIVPANASDVPVEFYSFYVGTHHTRTALIAKVTRFIVTGVTFTVTQASPAVFTVVGTAPANNAVVTLTTDGTLLTGLLEDTFYYVINHTTHTFQLSLTLAGSAINTAGTQSGTHTVRGSSIIDWPHFKPLPTVVTLFGMDVSVQATASASTSLTEPPTGPGYAKSGEHEGGYAKSVSLTTRREIIQPTLHSSITPSGDLTKTSTASVTASAVADAIVGSNATAAATTGGSGAITVDASGSVTCSSESTSPTAIPTTGIYFYDSNLATTEYGQAYVTVTLVDMSYFG